MATSIAGIDLGFNLPTFSTSGVGFWITVIAILVVFVLGIALGVWIYLQKKKFNIQIRDFENISGQGYQLVGRNVATLLKIGDGGEEVLLLKKGKTFRSAYGKKMGKNEYWFAKGQDGYWYNVTLGDLDTKMGMLDIEPIDRDMRYMHVAIRKNIADRYKKENKLDKYLPVIISFIIVVIMLVGGWFLISKIGDLIHEANGAIASVKPVADALSGAISKLDAICSASGIKPA